MHDKAAFLIPNKGLMVRDPSTKAPLSPDGEVKTLIGRDGSYWRRRIRDGGVMIGKPPVPIITKKRRGEGNS